MHNIIEKNIKQGTNFNYKKKPSQTIYDHLNLKKNEIQFNFLLNLDIFTVR